MKPRCMTPSFKAQWLGQTYLEHTIGVVSTLKVSLMLETKAYKWCMNLKGVDRRVT